MELESPSSDNAVLRGLTNSHRRRILLLLQDRASAVDVRDLATHLVAEDRDLALVDVTRDAVDPVLTRLVHTDLAALEAAGLVEWDRSTRTVGAATHPALTDPKLRRIVETEASGWDAVVDALADERRRIVLSVLKDREGEMARARLAKAVITRERDDTDEREPTEAARELLGELHHRHLPRLQRAGLVTYDVDLGTVAYEGHEALEDEWLDFRPSETPRSILPVADHSEDIWTIEGRNNVIARGQSLFEQAEDELFLMFTTDGLLEDGCIRRLQDAIDRGVDVYLGSQTPAVRDLVRERIPEAVVWEPQMDWLNLPPEYEKVGRLVFADRRAVMLATLGESSSSGVHAETAITGTGANNPVVVLLRDMLGSRLDHLDAQSEDFLAEIPL